MPAHMVNEFDDFIILKLRQRITEEFNDYMQSMAELFSFIIDDVLHIKPEKLSKYRTIGDSFHLHNEDVRKKYGVMPGNTFRAHFFYNTATWVEHRLMNTIDEIAEETPGEFEDWLRVNVFLSDISLDTVINSESKKIYEGIYDHEMIGMAIQILFPQNLLGKLEKTDTRFLYKMGKVVTEHVKQH